ncbi:MAG: biotin--[acetyl-CoA-carboxylase] ligase [Bacteroidia bacterium]
MANSFFKQIKIITLPKVKSTNDFALQKLKSGDANPGDIIVAKYQEAGRGQNQSKWFSSDGTNLLLSFICKDIQLKTTQIPALNMLVSLGLFNVVNNFFNNQTTIKWPNDILVNEKKIAGTLIETSIQGDFIKNAVIGIGLNVNEESFPEYLPNACSFYTLLGMYSDLDSILKIIIEQMDLHLSKLKQTPFEELKENYESVLFGMGAIRYFRNSQKNFEGIIRGLNSNGQLCVETENRIETFNHKEITFDLGKH